MDRINNWHNNAIALFTHEKGRTPRECGYHAIERDEAKKVYLYGKSKNSIDIYLDHKSNIRWMTVFIAIMLFISALLMFVGLMISTGKDCIHPGSKLALCWLIFPVVVLCNLLMGKREYNAVKNDVVSLEY